MCSGSLLNNANQDNKPFFLTAFHCVDLDMPYGELSDEEKNDAEHWSFRFHYKIAHCGGSVVNTYITHNYAEFRAAWRPTDFVLMELLSTICDVDCYVSFLGWDRSGNTPTSGTGIHHPNGDLMKISFDYHSLESNSDYKIGWPDGTISPLDTHWIVEYDNGAIEGGSSGSPLFDQNKRVIGQAHGSHRISCPPNTQWYGQFHQSWTGGGTDDTRLSNWLDPNNTTTTLNTLPCLTVNFKGTSTNPIIVNYYYTPTIIKSGRDINVQYVKVQNGAKLILDAPGEVNIISDFEVDLGSELEINYP